VSEMKLLCRSVTSSPARAVDFFSERTIESSAFELMR